MPQVKNNFGTDLLTNKGHQYLLQIFLTTFLSWHEKSLTKIPMSRFSEVENVYHLWG